MSSTSDEAQQPGPSPAASPEAVTHGGFAGFSQRLPAILLFGMPGTGKGTQGQLLGTMAGLVHVSTGEIFRGLDRTSDDGRAVRNRIDRGDLVPDELAVRIWRQWLEGEVRSGRVCPESDVLVLDGIPRSPAQCRLLEPYVDVLAVIHLCPASDEPIVERLRQRGSIDGRADDSSEDIIRRRLEIYRQTTAPVLGCYTPDVTFEIDPLGTPIEVNRRILEKIAPIIQTRDRAAD